MNFIKTIIKRPVTMLMLSIAIVVFGVMSLLNMQMALFPTIKVPVLAVSTTYVGADAETVEEEVTKKIEEQLRSMPNVTEITTYSMENVSMVMGEFSFATDVSVVENDLKNKLETIDFTQGVETPSIVKVDMADMPVAQVGMVSSLSAKEKEELTKAIEIDLKAIDGVSAVEIRGDIKRSFAIEMKAGSESYILNVAKALQTQNIELPLGGVEGENEYSIRAISKLTSLEELKNMNVDVVTPLGKAEQKPLSELANVSEQEEYENGKAYVNGEEAISFGVKILTTADITSVVQQVKATMEKYENSNVEMTILDDQSDFAKESVYTVWSSLIIGAVLAMIIILLFLGNLRSSLIISISMPLSVLGAISALKICGVGMNMVSMGGLAIGIGMLVDNSIVVIENITRHMEMGKTKEQSAWDGTREVLLPLIASTLTTVAVFFPIMFVEGMTKMIFKDMSLSIIFSLMFSLAMAVSVVPTLFAKFGRLSKSARRGDVGKSDGKVYYSAFENRYKSLLVGALKGKFFVILLSCGVLVFSAVVALSSGFEFMPPVDKGISQITIESLDKSQLSTEQASKIVEDYLLCNFEQVEMVSASVGDNGMFGGEDTSVLQVRVDTSKISTADFLAEVRKKEFDGIEVVCAPIDGIIATFMPNSSGISVAVLGDDSSKLAEIAEEIEKKIADIKEVGNFKTNIVENKTEYQITLDETHEIVQNYGVENVVQLLRIGIASQNITTIKTQDGNMDVVVSFATSEIDSLEKLQDIYVVPPTSFKPYGVKLSEVSEIKQVETTPLINKMGGKHVLNVEMQLLSGNMGNVASEVTDCVNQVLTSFDGYQAESTGVQDYLFDAFGGLFIALLISIFLVFAIIASQFESIRQTFVVIFSVPFAFAGAFFAIKLTGSTINVVSFVGIIMLVGVIVNNAIVMIDKFNQNIKGGMPPFSAVVYGATSRLRPILMTVLTTTLALLPLAAGWGANAGNMLQSMGIVVIGGMLCGTLVSLFLIPTIYAIFCGIKTPKRRR